MEGRGEQQRIVELELQQAQYEASLAERRYAACDPDNRLIAAQLEKSWEAALRRVEVCEARLETVRKPDPAAAAARLRRAGRQSRCRMERAGRDHARSPASPSRACHRHHCRRRRGGARGCPDDPLARRPAFAVAGPQAEVRRARLPHPRRGARRDAEHGKPLVGRRHRSVVEPGGHAHWSRKNLDRAPRQLAAAECAGSMPTVPPRSTANGSRCPRPQRRSVSRAIASANSSGTASLPPTRSCRALRTKSAHSISSDERVIAAIGRTGRPCRIDLENQLPMFPDT